MTNLIINDYNDTEYEMNVINQSYEELIFIDTFKNISKKNIHENIIMCKKLLGLNKKIKYNHLLKQSIESIIDECDNVYSMEGVAGTIGNAAGTVAGTVAKGIAKGVGTIFKIILNIFGMIAKLVFKMVGWLTKVALGIISGITGVFAKKKKPTPEQAKKCAKKLFSLCKKNKNSKEDLDDYVNIFKYNPYESYKNRIKTQSIEANNNEQQQNTNTNPNNDNKQKQNNNEDDGSLKHVAVQINKCFKSFNEDFNNIKTPWLKQYIVDLFAGKYDVNASMDAITGENTNRYNQLNAIAEEFQKVSNEISSKNAAETENISNMIEKYETTFKVSEDAKINPPPQLIDNANFVKNMTSYLNNLQVLEKLPQKMKAVENYLNGTLKGQMDNMAKHIESINKTLESLQNNDKIDESSINNYKNVATKFSKYCTSFITNSKKCINFTIRRDEILTKIYNAASSL